MDFIAAVKAFVKEACLLRNYKRMSKFMAVLSFILVLPWVCALLGVLAAYYCCLAMYKLAEAPVAQIKGCMEESGEKVKHATQFLIYWTAYPLVFACQVFLALAAFGLHWNFFWANIYGYLATLGGTTFAPFLANQPNRELQYTTEKFGKKRVFFFALLPYILVGAAAVLSLIGVVIAALGGALGVGALAAVGVVFFALAGLCGAGLFVWSSCHVLYICLAFRKGEPVEA